MTFFLQNTGYCDIQRVGKFNLFPDDFDASDVSYVNVPISLRMVAKACIDVPSSSDFVIGHQASAYKPALIPKFNETSKMYYIVNENNEITVLGKAVNG